MRRFKTFNFCFLCSNVVFDTHKDSQLKIMQYKMVWHILASNNEIVTGKDSDKNVFVKNQNSRIHIYVDTARPRMIEDFHNHRTRE